MNLNEYVSKQMEDPEFKKAYEDLAPEYEIIRAMIAARCEQKITQKELSQRTGIHQSHISRLESGNYNPSLKFLKRIAAGLGKELHVSFK